MADEDVAKQVKRGNDYISFREQVEGSFRVLNSLKSNITAQRAFLVTEFGSASGEVAELDALMTALRGRVTAFGASY